MDNRAPEGSTWNRRSPALELARPSDDGFDPGLTGFDEEEPGRMLAHGARWAAAIQRAVDDVAHAGPELETVGGAFRSWPSRPGRGGGRRTR